MQSVPAQLKEKTDLEKVVVRFAGDSGDGIQLMGTRFALSCAIAGNDLRTFPDYPAEIRAPAGTTYGVSAFQIQFGTRNVSTQGDVFDVLVVFNPSALKMNIAQLRPGGLLIVNSENFTRRNLMLAGYSENPLEGEPLKKFRLLSLDISSYTLKAVATFDLGRKDSLRCKNMWALGLVYWLFERDRLPVIEWLKNKFTKTPLYAEANIMALNAGHIWAETAELSSDIARMPLQKQSCFPAGLYRQVTGSDALALGLVCGARLAELDMLFCSYPITPASPLLHRLASMDEEGLAVFQAEDEIAAICSALGASFAGCLGVTSSSGPGMALKSEALGLAISTELPLIIINAQRGGPSTGLPTRTEQSDLFQAVLGRHGDAPLCVFAARSPSDAFECALEAVKIATRHKTPVILLTDGYIANAAEPWLVPDMAAYDSFPAFSTVETDPFKRDPETLARSWVPAGTEEGAHCIGGLEKDMTLGTISYDGDNHHKMTQMRARKIEKIADFLPLQKIERGSESGKLALVGWGSSYGALQEAVDILHEQGYPVSHIHLRHISPFARNLEELLKGFQHILVPEMNNGQLSHLLRARYLIPAQGYNRIEGKPLHVGRLVQATIALWKSHI